MRRTFVALAAAGALIAAAVHAVERETPESPFGRLDHCY